MTEEDAKTKWCPHARCGNEAGCNRNGIEFPRGPFCIGSECSQWRWEKRITNRDEIERAASTFTIATRRPEPIFENTEHGYCGLAGKP